MELSVHRRVGGADIRERLMATVSSSPAARSGNGTTAGDVDKQLDVIRNDVAELTQQVGNLVTQIKDDAMAQVKSQARRAQASVDGALSDMQDKGREAVDSFREVADTFGDAIEDSLKRRPYATLAIVAGIGFLFGAAWRR
jgi:ElaB/YqjD/DUF883 family membrane-anchored ribosome-binding protein